MSGIERNNGNEKDQFGLPDGYFEQSANVLKNKMEWLEEHRAYPALKMAWRNDVFSVPDQYFEKKSVALERVPYVALQKISRRNIFSVPANYFENLELVQETEPTISVSKEQCFIIPNQYFEKNAAAITSRLLGRGGARIIALRARNWQFAAAACLLFTAGWWIYSKILSKEEPLDCGGIACVDRREILEGKNLEMLDEDDLLKIVNVKRLEEGLKNNVSKELPTSDTVVSDEDLLDNL